MKLKYEYIGGPRDGEKAVAYVAGGPLSTMWERSEKGVVASKDHMRVREACATRGDDPDDVTSPRVAFYEYVFENRTGNTVRYRATGVVKMRDEINNEVTP